MNKKLLCIFATQLRQMIIMKLRHIGAILTTLALFLLVDTVYAQQTKEDTQKEFFLNKIFKKKSDTRKIDKQTEHPYRGGGAIISFDKIFFDYGEVLQSSKAEVTFEIFNTGNGDLRIDSVEISCGCVDVEFTSKLIKPKGKTQMKVRYNTNIVGEIKKSITVVCNDSLHKRTTLLLTGNVVLNK